jgi:hypothetical protein
MKKLQQGIAVALTALVLSWPNRGTAQESRQHEDNQRARLATPARSPHPTKQVVIRGLWFGSNEATIRRTEKTKPVKVTQIGAVRVLIFTDSLLGEPVFVRYRLLNDSLYSMGYGFQHPGGCTNSMKLFEKLKTELSLKYGEPKLQDLVGRDQCLRIAQWHYNSDGRPSTVSIGLDGTDYSSDLDVFYEDDEQTAKVAGAQAAVDRGKL